MTLRDEIAAAAVRALNAGPYDMADALLPIVERVVRKGCDIGWQRGIEEAHTGESESLADMVHRVMEGGQ